MSNHIFHQQNYAGSPTRLYYEIAYNKSMLKKMQNFMKPIAIVFLKLIEVIKVNIRKLRDRGLVEAFCHSSTTRKLRVTNKIVGVITS